MQMASGNYISCGPCMFDNITQDAGKWCTDCEEGLCEDCENVHRKGKITRNHRVISIEDYRKIENVSITQVCEHHGETLEWFCKTHDEVLCVACVPSKHKACSDVIPIRDSSANSRQSAALFDLEEKIEGTLCNVKQFIKNRGSAAKEIERQELTVKTMVLETRTKINNQLDKLQKSLLYEIRSTSENCKSKYMKILQKLKSTEELLTKIKDQTIHMKQFSSDIQVFLGTREVNKQIESEIASIKSEIASAKDYELKVDIYNIIDKLSNEVEEFGQIRVSESSAKFDFQDLKIDQAQIEINVPTSRNISDIKLQLIQTFQLEKTGDITGCVILPNGHLLMANDTKENKLIEYSDTGDHLRDIPVSAQPYDIAVIDPDRIVVTYGDALFIEIINTDTFNVEKKISLQKSCLGVSHANGRIYVIHGKDIKVMDLSGKLLERFKAVSKYVSYIKVSRDRIFCTDDTNNTVHSCDLNGKEIWQLGSDSIDCPKGVTIDSHKNVYVVGLFSDNLTIIQHDGKNSKTILTELDGLYLPKSLDLDKYKKRLLICNKKGKVALYKIV